MILAFFWAEYPAYYITLNPYSRLGADLYAAETADTFIVVEAGNGAAFVNCLGRAYLPALITESALALYRHRPFNGQSFNQFIDPFYFQ